MPTAGFKDIISKFLGVAVLVTLSGCATVQSIDFPWEKTDQSDASSAPAEAASSEASEAGADSSEANSAEAFYWARRAVSASRRMAYAANVEDAARSTPEVVASSESALSAPYGRWETDSLPSEGAGVAESSNEPSEEVASAPETRSIEREGAGTSEEPTESNNPPSDNSEGSADPKGATATDSSPQNASRNEPAPSTADAGSHGWPVGFPGDGVRDRGSRTRVDPRVETEIYELDNSEDRNEVTSRWGLNPPDADGAVAIPGTFVRKIRQYDDYDDLDDEQLDNQVAVVVPGRSVEIYAGEREVASKKLPGSADLPDQLASVHPVRLVEDGTTQLLVSWPRESTDDQERVEYRIGLLKAIGPQIGTIFERTVATRSSPEGDLRRSGYVEFLRGDEHRFIQWTPATDNGEPDADKAAVLEWNEWEGVYRVPKPPPTAPEQRS